MKKLLFPMLCTFLLVSITSCGAQEECSTSSNETVSEESALVESISEETVSEESISEETVSEESASEESVSRDTIISAESISDFDSRDAETLFADMMIDLYLSGYWDGLPIEMEGHKVSLGWYGQLLVDGFLSYPSKFHCQHPLDFPNPFNDGVWDTCNTICIPGKGTYVLLDETYVKYLRGERIDLPGNPLNWKEGEGVDVDFGHAYLDYCERYDKMFLTTPMLELNDGSGVPTLKPVGPSYLYIFPDYDVSEIEFVGRAKRYSCDEDGFSYVDENNIYWEYCEEDGKYFFKKVAQIFE